MIETKDTKINQMIKRVYDSGQDHIFRFWPELDEQQKQNLITQLIKIDFELLNRLIKQAQDDNTAISDEELSLEPPDIVTLKQREKRDRDVIKIGEKALRNGQVAAFLVAGGQGTRLGYDGPKGKYPVTPVKKKSLFQVHAEKLRAVGLKYNTIIPWYIMTSETNHQETLDFFREKSFFGYKEKELNFFRQEMIPAIDKNGKLILDAPDHIFMNPNGHGGSLKALWTSGALKEMQEKGIKYIFYFQVDNPLVKICDPCFLGYHITEKSEMSSIAVRKHDPDEKVGLICKINGKTGVVEYSDIDQKNKNARTADGSLKFWAGSIAIHIIDVDFVEKENKDGFKLPYHIANKKIAYLNEDGKLIEPEGKNGIKFETFIFDALLDTEKSFTVEEERKEIFSPLKNKEGSDSIETVDRDLRNYYGAMLESRHIDVPRDDSGNVTVPIEISPLFALDREDIKHKDPDIKSVDSGLYLGD